MIMLQDWEPEFLVYGDLGVHSESLPLLNQEALKGYTAILHVGDFGYNLEQTIDVIGAHYGENVSYQTISNCSLEVFIHESP